MKALIVDDCMIARELLAVAVERYATIDQAENGEQALQMLEQALGQSEPYDLICLDLNMPGMGGHETLRGIRTLEEQLGSDTRATVFMITASSSPDDMMEALLSGSCDDYLTKPVMHKTLIELLQKHNLV
jgi:two-component system chemotaxis response regulator CheY